MSTKLEKAKQLIAQKKYKKALELLRKVPLESFESLELQIQCLFNQKQYKLAKIRLEKAKTFANTPQQKLNILNNLASVSQRLGQAGDGIGYLKQILDMDGTLNTANQRMSLVKLAYIEKDFKTVEKYGPLLINTQEHSMAALLALSQTAIKTKNTKDAIKYLDRIVAEIRTKNVKDFNPRDILYVLDSYHELAEHNKEKVCLDYLEEEFKYEAWFINAKNRSVEKKSENVIKDFKTITPKMSAKAGITGENEKTVRFIKNLKASLEDMGSKFHPNLTITESQGEIAVLCNKLTTKNEIFMDVPLECIPLRADYRFSLDDSGKLTCLAKKNMMNPKSRHIMNIMVEMFNAADKLSRWKASYPLFSLAGFKAIFDKLLLARTNAGGYSIYYFSNKKQIPDEDVINSFFSSRVFSFLQNDLHAAKIKTKNEIERGFIPLIDLTNHSMQAEPFHSDSNSNSLKTYLQPGEAGREVFVRYNLDDPLVTFLSYGFIDQSANWVYTIPLSISTPSGLTLDIKNDLAMVQPDTLPTHMKGLANYFPAQCNRQGNIVTISKLVIPGKEHAGSLKTILAYILKQIDFDGRYTNETKLNQEIDSIENQILSLNRTYWQELRELLDVQMSGKKPLPEPAGPLLKELCEFYIEHIRQYTNYGGVMIKLS